MSEFLVKPVRYLQITDFDANGNLINPKIPKNVPVFILIQSSNCGWCVKTKPIYQMFANNDPTSQNYFATTIQIDSSKPKETEFRNFVNKIDESIQGWPHIVVYYNGKRMTYDGNRTAEDFKKFADAMIKA